jgi:DNA-binding transcriptional MerR regulator
MQDREFDLKELCEAASVTERTVRYYIAEGLLPPPTGVKSQSRYTTGHLERLRLIQSLKEQDFSLRQIKTLLEGKAAETVKPLLDPASFSEQAVEFLRRQPAPPPTKAYASPFNPVNPATPSEPSGNIPGVFQALNQASLTNPANHAGTKAPHPLQMGFTRSWPNEISPVFEQDSRPAEPDPETPAPAELSQLWEKVVIAPGIELMLDKTIADQHRAALSNLAEVIKRKLGQ